MPELDKRCRVHLNPERFMALSRNYIEVKGEWKYLYRAVDSEGNTTLFVECLRDASGRAVFSVKL